MFEDSPSEASDRVMQVVLEMKKLDIAAIERAYGGEPARR